MTKKAPNSLDRKMTKLKRNQVKNSCGKGSSNKQFLMHTVVGIIGCIVASGMIAFLSTTTSVHNLATVMPSGSTMMMEQMAGRSFLAPENNPHHHYSKGHSHHHSGPNTRIQIPTSGSNGLIFADARSTDASKQPQESQVPNSYSHANGGKNHSNGVISLDSDFRTMNYPAAATSSPNANGVRHGNGKFSHHNYNYYYYDSNSQAFHLHDEYTMYPAKPLGHPSSQFQASLALPGRYQPTLCNDRQTIGFTDLSTLRNAISELNSAYTLAVSRWEHYNAALAEYKIIKFNHQHDTASGEVDIEAPPPLPEHILVILQTEPDPFIICPHTTLRGSSLAGRHLPIYIDAEDVLVECNTCVLDTPGTHFSFGPHAKNVIVRGVTMMGATESSIIFRHNGAEVNFEDCYWVNNDSVGIHGSVADVNSTSIVKFYRCEVSDVKQSSRTGTYSPNQMSSSLTLRG